MRFSSLVFASAACTVVALCSSRDAHALGPVDIEIAGRIGYATKPSSSDLVANPFGFGMGARAGVSIFGIYGGVSGIYYFGSSGTRDGLNGSIHTGMEGFEVGYTLPIPYVKIRPQVGIGNATFGGSASGSLGGSSVNGSSGSASDLYFEPGVLVFVPIGILTVGADLNALVLTGVDNGLGGSKTYASFSFHAQVGVRF